MMKFATMHSDLLPTPPMFRSLMLMTAWIFFASHFATQTSLAQNLASSDGDNAGSGDPVFASWQKQAGVQACGQCHYEAGGGAFARPDVSFSKQNELQFWLANDKHAIARRRIEPLTVDELRKEMFSRRSDLGIATFPADWFGASNVLSRRICDKLGYDVSKPEGYALFRNNCLTCHGGYSGDVDNVHFAKDEGAQPGISCNYCHQIDGNMAWIQQHGIQGAAKQWRNLAPEQKVAAGMRDLVNAKTQAANCYDCHIGNRDKNMFVNHVMYAAGHPPLPGIELQTFCTSMPQHWQSESALYESLSDFEGRDEYFRVNFPALFAGDPAKTISPKATYWNTRKMIVGALAARLHSVDLMLASTTDDRWADYSLYDCAACHHELREPSQRQARGYVGAPGRPRQSEWPETLLSVAIDVAGSDLRANIDATETKLAAAFAQTPFGEPAVVASIGKELQSSLQTVIDRVQGKPITSIAAREVIRRLASTPKDKLLVYDSGRQIVWAIQVIAEELAKQGEPLPEALAAKIAALSDASETGIEAKLPAGRQVFIYPDNLYEDLNRKSAYSSDELAERLAVIAKEIEVRPAVPAVAAR